jgi:hypothetical protein
MVVRACHPSNRGSIGMRIMVQVGPGKNARHYLKNNQNKKDWGCDSSGSMPVYQEWGPFWALLAHACNPSYSGSRDQENLGSRIARANSSQDPVLKIPKQKRASGVVQAWDPEFKPQYLQNTHTHTHTHTHTGIDIVVIMDIMSTRLAYVHIFPTSDYERALRLSTLSIQILISKCSPVNGTRTPWRSS